MSEHFATIGEEYGRVFAEMEKNDFDADFDAAMAQLDNIQNADFATLARAGTKSESHGRLEDFVIFDAIERAVESIEAAEEIQDNSDPFAAWR